MANSNLSAARKAKNDEFYTQYVDIEKEMNAYLEYNEDAFRGGYYCYPATTQSGAISPNTSSKTLNASA